MDPVHIVSISGGKDSTALRLLAIEKGIEHIAAFCDTGHEHPATYEYVDYLESVTGPIRRVKADFSEAIAKKRMWIARDRRIGRRYKRRVVEDPVLTEDGRPMIEIYPDEETGDEVIVPVVRRRVSYRDMGRARWTNKAKRRALACMIPTGIPFLDLCLMKGRFPSTRVRFCSEELKQVPMFEQVVDPLLQAGHEVISWQGVRADESGPRAKLPPIEDVGGGLWNYRPILAWTAEDVFAMHRKHGVKPNPLYLQGMGRVGCMPCIHAGKDELRQIAMRFPEEIRRVAEWEALVAETSKRGEASLFAADKTPGWVRGMRPSRADLERFRIDAVVEWSKTGKGGRQRDIFADDEPPLCSSVYGLCE